VLLTTAIALWVLYPYYIIVLRVALARPDFREKRNNKFDRANALYDARMAQRVVAIPNFSGLETTSLTAMMIM
jgi:hypothetical protein